MDEDIENSGSTLIRWPFYFANALILGTVVFFVSKADQELSMEQVAICVFAVALSAMMFFVPHLVEYFIAISTPEESKSSSGDGLLQKTYLELENMKETLDDFGVKLEKVPAIVEAVAKAALSDGGDSQNLSGLEQEIADLRSQTEQLVAKPNESSADPRITDLVAGVAALEQRVDRLAEILSISPQEESEGKDEDEESEDEDLADNLAKVDLILEQTQALPEDVGEVEEDEEESEDENEDSPDDSEEDESDDLDEKDSDDEESEEESTNEESYGEDDDELEEDEDEADSGEDELKEDDEDEDETVSDDEESDDSDDDLKEGENETDSDDEESDEESYGDSDEDESANEDEDEKSYGEDDDELDEESDDEEPSEDSDDEESDDSDEDLDEDDEPDSGEDDLKEDEDDETEDEEPTEQLDLEPDSETGEESQDEADESGDEEPSEPAGDPPGVLKGVFQSDVLVAKILPGIGNKVHVRGEGPGLSWDQGVSMSFLEIGKWGWSPSDKSASLVLQLYRNDEEPDRNGKVELEPGEKVEITPIFDE